MALLDGRCAGARATLGCGHCVECCDPSPPCLAIPGRCDGARGLQGKCYADEWALPPRVPSRRPAKIGYSKRHFMRGVEYRSLYDSQDIAPSLLRQRRGLSCLGLIQLPRKCTNVDPKRGAEILHREVSVPARVPNSASLSAGSEESAATAASCKRQRAGSSSSASGSTARPASLSASSAVGRYGTFAGHADSHHRPFMTGSKVGISYFLNPSISMAGQGGDVCLCQGAPAPPRVAGAGEAWHWEHPHPHQNQNQNQSALASWGSKAKHETHSSSGQATHFSPPSVLQESTMVPGCKLVHHSLAADQLFHVPEAALSMPMPVGDLPLPFGPGLDPPLLCCDLTFP